MRANGKAKRFESQGFKKGHDPRRHVAPGNRYAAGVHAKSPTHRHNFITQQLISQLNDLYVDKDDPELTQRKMTNYARMVEQVVKACTDGDLEAIRFAWERVEGKMTQRVQGKHVHAHRVDLILPELSDEELALMEKINRKVLESEGINLLEHMPEGAEQDD
jgi:hypothetical protein